MIQIFKENHHIAKKASKRNKKISIYDHHTGFRLLKMLENTEVSVTGCRLCEQPVDENPRDHLNSKEHKKIRDECSNLTIADDYKYSIITLESEPNDISEELQKEKEESIKIKHRKLKQQLL